VLTRDANHMIFWVPAISQESFERAYRGIGASLRIPGVTDDNANIKQLVKDYLSMDGGRDWLMIVDNTDDPRVLMQSPSGDLQESRLHHYLPRSARGKILFTTRSRKMAGELTPGNVLELHDMSGAEARELLARRITKQALLKDGKAVDKLLSMLEYLPLAIVQAAAFIDINNVSVSEYVSLLQKRETAADLFGQDFEDANRYREMERTIARTWHISFDQLRRQDPLAIEYLSFMACIDRISIPQSLLPLDESVVKQVKAIGTLKGYAFITERQQDLRASDRFFDMHRLVHLASGWWLQDHGEERVWVAKVAERLEELIPYGEHENREVWSTYLSHADHVASTADDLDDKARASLLDRIGRCQLTLGYYSAAALTHRQALTLRRARLGQEHPDALTSMSELALVLDMQGKYEEAEGMNRQTLARREKVLGPDHPDTLTSMGNLAGVLDRQGKYEEAEGMNRQTLARREKVLGLDHPDTLVSVYCLAYVLAERSFSTESNILYERASSGFARVLGSNHPTTRACRRHHSEMKTSLEQDEPSHPESTNGTNTVHGSETSKLSRTLARIGLRRSKFSTK
jgi:tetratricopeptide (TPR) repeat protein